MSTRTKCGIGCVWHQAGNRTGHCSQCHRTFSGETAFDAHQLLVSDGGKVVCRDPGTLTYGPDSKKAGEPRFRTFIDAEGAEVWRSTAELDPAVFKAASDA